MSPARARAVLMVVIRGVDKSLTVIELIVLTLRDCFYELIHSS